MRPWTFLGQRRGSRSRPSWSDFGEGPLPVHSWAWGELAAASTDFLPLALDLQSMTDLLI